jgi:hypothetical protein
MRLIFEEAYIGTGLVDRVKGSSRSLSGSCVEAIEEDVEDSRFFLLRSETNDFPLGY